MKEGMNQVVVQVAMAEMIALKDSEAGPWSNTIASHSRAKWE